MALKELKLTRFKNYHSRNFKFGHYITGIVGANGIGKTNILDAIYLLCIGKGYFLSSDKKMIQWGGDFFRVDGQFDVGHVVIKQKSTEPKVIEYNRKKYDRLADHVGRHPVIMISPDDIELINGASLFRRKWMDIALCQVYPNYLQSLASYNRLHKQRNAYLKLHVVSKSTDVHLLDTYDYKMVPLAEEIYDIRRQFLLGIESYLQKVHNEVSGQNDTVVLSYKSDLINRSFEQVLLDNRRRDILLQRTTEGPHRDDFIIGLNNEPAKLYGSQGQKKTILFAIQIALSDWLTNVHQKKAYLLLDDVYDKLDMNRTSQLINRVIAGTFEQVFMTDAHETRLKDLMESLEADFGYVHLTKEIRDEEAE